MSDVIKGKIAKIVDEYSVILNIGSNHGVLPKMIFDIYDLGDEIKDPDTGESLGKWEIVKGRVMVKHVQEKLSFATVLPREKKKKGTTLSAQMAAVSMQRKHKEDSLRVKTNQISGMPKIKPISVGDHVKQVGMIKDVE